ncbi:MAG: DUF2752 domain-containing protein [Planctomycetes bacterium]|nr:DUF2752 domain-containing protein [Planctomycetota bacterium]
MLGLISPRTLAVVLLLLAAAFFAFEPARRAWDPSYDPAAPPQSGCGFRERAGLPCPTCGMTRSTAAFRSGAPIECLRFHPAGLFLGLLSVIGAAASIAWLLGWRGRGAARLVALCGYGWLIGLPVAVALVGLGRIGASLAGWD